jgi:penicillin amidase
MPGENLATRLSAKGVDMSRVIRGILLGFLALVLILAILAAVIVPLNVRHSFPKVDGNFKLSGLQGPVEIYRDAYGIPQIYATTTHDLFMAQGYVHAQDRFWQMDFWRHIGAGRLAEMFGESQLDTDRFLRTLGWARVAQQELNQTDPDNVAILQAYADGVNAYLADHKGSALSVEYAVLKLLSPNYQVEPWTPLNTITWAKVMSWDLGGNMDMEIYRARLLKTLTPEQISQLVPPYPSNHPVIVPTPNTSASAAADASLALFRDAQVGADLQALANHVQGLEALLGPLDVGIGSNNWTISGKLTVSGKPLLANDPHLAAQMPSIWYEIGLHCVTKGSTCPFEVTGFSFAGVPGVIIGHNDRIAWGVTNVNPDVEDLYIEKINPQNPNQYEYKGQWVDMQIVNETLQTSGGKTESLTVRYTRHGPIISDTYGDLKDFNQKAGGVQFPDHYAIALRWTALEPSQLIEAFLMFDQAQNWDGFRQAAQNLVVPAQNLVYADVDGNIGYQTPGNIPIRSQGDGTLPVPGWTGDNEWTGYIPFDQLPYAHNPPQGFIATANNAVVGPDYPHLITKDWDYGFRAARIVEMIQNAPGPIDIAYIQKMQGDDKDLLAESLVPILMQLQLNDTRLQNDRKILQGWDFQDQMDSAPAGLYNAFYQHLLADTFNDELPKDLPADGGDRWFEVLDSIAQQPDSPWWDNKATPATETRDQIFRQALSEAVDELSKHLGNDPQQWQWGKLHTLTFRNQSLGESGVSPIEALLNRGPFQTSGGASIVNATGWDASEPYQVLSLPSMRMIVDLGNLQNSLSIHTTGQSGHAYSPHYIDMADLWRTIQYHPMLWDRAQIEQQAKDHMHLQP